MMRLNRGLNRALRGKEVVTKCIPFIYAELAGKCRMMWVENKQTVTAVSLDFMKVES